MNNQQSNEFWALLQSQPGVGVLIVDCDGLVLFSNEQARKIYYGSDFNPVGKTIEEIEGPEFASERMPAIQRVIATEKPIIIRHIRGGKNTLATIWPMEPVKDQKRRVIAITRQCLADRAISGDLEVAESKLVDLGPLDVLTRREIQVLALVGHGVPLKRVARELGVAQRTVERYRTDIARKLHINSIAEIANLVQIAGLELSDADLPRLHRWQNSND